MEIKQIADIFQAKKVNIRMKREFENNNMIIYPPKGVGSIVDDLEIEKIEIIYSLLGEEQVFSVCINEFLYINYDYKLTDNESKKAYFEIEAKGSKLKYDSLDHRALFVANAIIKGKISLEKDKG